MLTATTNFNFIVECNYHTKSEGRFQMEVLEDLGDEYLLQLLPEWRNFLQDGDKPFKLRKCLIDSGREDSIYIRVPIKNVEETSTQLSLFEI